MTLASLVFSASAQAPDIPESQSLSDQYVISTYVPDTKVISRGYQPTGNGQCVNFVQRYGYSQYSGNAKDWVKYINSYNPVVGGVVVLDQGYFGHLALILYYTDDYIYVVEQNYEGLYIVSYRYIDRDSSTILGYIQPDPQ